MKLSGALHPNEAMLLSLSSAVVSVEDDICWCTLQVQIPARHVLAE